MNGKSFGIVLLSLYLIAIGMVAVLSLTFDGLPIILGVIAILAGILLLIGK